MMAAVRTVMFTIDRSTVNPPVPQYAGVQGEHNATLPSFELPEAWNAVYQHRLEYVDGLQHAWVPRRWQHPGEPYPIPFPRTGQELGA
jgi:hypothetical protein